MELNAFEKLSFTKTLLAGKDSKNLRYYYYYYYC